MTTFGSRCVWPPETQPNVMGVRSTRYSSVPTPSAARYTRRAAWSNSHLFLGSGRGDTAHAIPSALVWSLAQRETLRRLSEDNFEDYTSSATLGFPTTVSRWRNALTVAWAITTRVHAVLTQTLPVVIRDCANLNR